MEKEHIDWQHSYFKELYEKRISLKHINGGHIDVGIAYGRIVGDNAT